MEAAIVTPMVFALFFGIVEMGFFSRTTWRSPEPSAQVCEWPLPTRE